MPNTILITSNAGVSKALVFETNWAIGVGDSEKGPTSATGFWNGVTPPADGYTVYEYKASEGPSVITFLNDSVFVTWSNNRLGRSDATMALALPEWYSRASGSGGGIVVDRDYETITTDGLTQLFDAGFTVSYPRTGLAWRNLAATGTSEAVLTNGPTWTVVGGGSIVFDGTNDYAAAPSMYNPGTTGEFTLELWVYPTGPYTAYVSGSTTNQGGFYGQGFYANTNGFGLGMRTISGPTNQWTFQVRNGSTISEINYSSFTNGYWYHVVGTFTRNSATGLVLYVNGSQVATASTTGIGSLSLTPTEAASIGRAGDSNGFYYAGCRVAIARNYSRALTAGEISANYAAQKSRFELLLDSYSTNNAYGWSVARQLKVSATNAIRIRRSNDNATADIGFVNGELDTAAITAFVGSNTAFITTIYEQNGSGYDFTQTTASNQPRIVNAGTLEVLNTKPAALKPSGSNSVTMSIPSSTSYFNFLHNGTLSSSFCVASHINDGTVVDYANKTTLATSIGTRVDNNSNATRVIVADGSTNIVNCTSATAIAGLQYLVSLYYNVSSATASQKVLIYRNDGAAQSPNIQSGSPTTSDASQNLQIIATGTISAEKRFQELILLPSQPTLADFRRNINNFYNIYKPPINIVLPVISGTVGVNYTLSVTSGTWTSGNFSTVTYSYQWRKNGVNISGSTSTTYKPVTSDVGANIDCVVVATNGVGSSSAIAVAVLIPTTATLLLDSYATNTAYGWSVARQLKGSATVAIRVRRSNDNAETDIGFVDNQLDTATLLSWTGSDSAFITTMYDQLGSGYNFTQTTAANQPRIVNSGVLDLRLGKPAATSLSDTTQLSVPSSQSYFKFLHDGTQSALFSVHTYTSTSSYHSIVLSTQAAYQETGAGFRITGFVNRFRNTVGNGSDRVVINDGTPNLSNGQNRLVSCYISAGSSPASSRSLLYTNGGNADQGNTYTNSPTTGNAGSIAYIIGQQTGATMQAYQELIIMPSQPTLNSFRGEINGFYSIY